MSQEFRDKVVDGAAKIGDGYAKGLAAGCFIPIVLLFLFLAGVAFNGLSGR